MTLTYPASRTEAPARGTVHLYEDNGGILYLWSPYGQCAVRGFVGLEQVGADGGSFGEDAAALLRGDTDDWTLEPITDADDPSQHAETQLVAEYADGVVTIHETRLGAAAREYLQADIAWARDTREA